jgi:HEPN domain-containing protein
VTKAPLDAEEHARWRAEAERALHSARVQADADIHNWACFAAEQAAQLAVKGLLHGLGRAPWGHDLVRLGAMLAEAGIEPPLPVSDAMRRLGRHYIPSRYPDAHPLGPPGDHYGAADVREALSDADAIIAFVDATWEKFHG